MDRAQSAALFAIFFVQCSQAIAITMPYNVVVFMVRDFIGNGDSGTATEAQVGMAAGWLAGVYSIGQFLSSYGWGAFSDSYGRKSVIQIGLASSFVSILALGFSTTYSAAAWTRFLGGLFNGYLVALKSSIAELYGEEQQAQALGYLSFGWGAGSIFGPVLGGFLMHPCDKYALGSACSTTGIFRQFPYLFPYLFAAFMALLSVICTHYMLPETHAFKDKPLALCNSFSSWKQWPRTTDTLVDGSAYKHEDTGKHLPKQRDCFPCEMELPLSGRSTSLAAFRTTGPLISRSNSTFSSTTGDASISLRESQSLLVDAGELEHQPSSASCGRHRLSQHAWSAVTSDGGFHVNARTSQHCIDALSKEVRAVSLRGDATGAYDLVTSNSTCFLELDTNALEYLVPWHKQRLLVLLIIGFGIVAFMFCLLDEVVPIYASTPRLHNGMGMNGSQLSVPFSVGGAVLMLVSIFVYPVVQQKIGCHRCLEIGLLSFAISCFLFPSCTVIDQASRTTAYIAFTVTTCIRCVASSFTFTSSMVLINVATNATAGNQIAWPSITALFVSSALIFLWLLDPLGTQERFGVLLCRTSKTRISYTTSMACGSCAGEVNGAGQALVALVRGLAPFMGGYFWSLSVASSVPHSQYAVFLFDAVWSIPAFILYQRISS